MLGTLVLVAAMAAGLGDLPQLSPETARTLGYDAIDLRSEITQAEVDQAPSFREFHKVMGWNFTKGLFSADNIGPLLTGSAATLATLPFDDDISDALRDEADWLGESGDIIGNPVTIAAATGTLLLITPFTDDQKFKSFAFTLAQAQILDSSLKYAMKFSVPRERPNGDNDNSFPSGHTSGAVAFATVLHHHYGLKWGIPAYAVAGFVGASRIAKGKHYLSDVVFGAAMGYIAGFTAIRGTDRAVAQRRLSVYPIVGRGQRGVSVIIEF